MVLFNIWLGLRLDWIPPPPDTTLARTYEVEHGVQLVPLGLYVQDVDYTNSTVQVRCGAGRGDIYIYIDRL